MNTGEIVKVSEQTGHILVLDNNKQIHEFTKAQWQEPFPPQVGYKVTFVQEEWIRYQTQTTSEQETANNTQQEEQAKQQAENTQNTHNSSSVYQEFDYQQAQQQEQAQNNQNQQNFQQSQTQQQQHNQAPKRKVQNDELIVIDYDKGIWATYFYCWKNSFNYTERARRKEFWFFQLADFITIILSFFVFMALGMFFAVVMNMSEREAEAFGSWIAILFYLVNLFPLLSVSARRCHDINLSGWLAPLCCIPYIGGVFAIVIGLIDSKPKENQWGLSPKYGI